MCLTVEVSHEFNVKMPILSDEEFNLWKEPEEDAKTTRTYWGSNPLIGGVYFEDLDGESVRDLIRNSTK
jgi:hypothetical protein